MPETLSPTGLPAPALRLLTIAQLSQVLEQLRRDTPGVLSATLASTDGLTIASTLTRSHEADRIAAMSGSISALAGALTRETGHDAPERVILESANGRILAMSVPAATGEMVLAVVASPAALLGKLLWSCAATAQALRECTLHDHLPPAPAGP